MAGPPFMAAFFLFFLWFVSALFSLRRFSGFKQGAGF
jgi:hypothetical protein